MVIAALLLGWKACVLLATVVWRLGVLLPLGLSLVALAHLVGLVHAIKMANRRRRREELLRPRMVHFNQPPPPRPLKRPSTSVEYPSARVLVKGRARTTTYSKGLPSTGLRPKGSPVPRR